MSDPDTPLSGLTRDVIGMNCGMWGNIDQDSNTSTDRIYYCKTSRELSDDLNYGCGLSYSESLTFIFSVNNSVCPETNISTYSEGIPDVPVE